MYTSLLKSTGQAHVTLYTTLPDSVFFFSSRRRHTRFDCDWSSDVCSSDLRKIAIELFQLQRTRGEQHAALPAERRLVDQAGGMIVVEDRQRAVPVTSGAAKKIGRASCRERV